MADIHAPIRAGSDIAFLGGLINYVINSERWNSEPFFQEYVANYTNAATIINEDFQDTEDEAVANAGVFSGLGPYKEGEVGPQRLRRPVRPETWQYARTAVGDQGRAADHRPVGRAGGRSQASRASEAAPAPVRPAV